MSAFLQVNQLVKQYGSQRALDDVSFDVQAGECFGLLGPNGAGKTTLISILSCLRAADSGTATLLEQRLHPTNQTIRQAIGIAPQEIALYGSLTARENLAFFGKLYGMQNAFLKKRVESLLEAVGLQNKADARAETFSGGMLRRLNLAAALVHQPQLLLLDEPTAGVDPQSRHHLFEEIRSCTKAGTTILYTTHYMEEVEALCSRVAILDHGRMIACDTLPHLINLIPGKVHISLHQPEPTLLQRLAGLAHAEVTTQSDGKQISLTSPDSSAALVGVVHLLGELGVKPDRIEAQPPNLEKVFLHLTGRALRD